MIFLPLGISCMFNLEDREEEHALGPWSVLVG